MSPGVNAEVSVMIRAGSTPKETVTGVVVALADIDAATNTELANAFEIIFFFIINFLKC
jgi:hypothetical protein